jgi:uncharacterized protein YaaN involved in tellurite resistance
MSIQIDTLKDIETISLSSFSLDKEKEQMRDQILMLEQEIDRQSTIIDALVKAIRVIERG